jgi:hypothetical protein
MLSVYERRARLLPGLLGIALQDFSIRSIATCGIGARLAYWAAQGADIVSFVKPELEVLRDDFGEAAAFFRKSADFRVCVALARDTSCVAPAHAYRSGIAIACRHAGSNPGFDPVCWKPFSDMSFVS